MRKAEHTSHVVGHICTQAEKRSDNIFQLYLSECKRGYSFGIVFSPRHEGMIILCERLTKSGKLYLDSLHDKARKKEKDIRDYIIVHSSYSPKDVPY